MIENLKKEKEKILSSRSLKNLMKKIKNIKELSKDYKSSLNTYYQTVDHRLR